MITHLKEKYEKEAMPGMKKKFGYKNDMAIPKIEKAVVNIGFGRLVAGKSPSDAKKVYGKMLEDLNMITGQKLTLRNAKKSISSFKIREGMPVGAACTLRKKKMFDFLEMFIHVALPRSRDFQGIDQKAIDQEGNLNVGIKEHTIFPGVSAESAKQIFSFEVNVTTTANNREEGLELFRLLGFPIKKDKIEKD